MLGLIGQLGITMLVPIVGCTLAGGWLGNRIGMPVLAVLFFIIGAVAGFQGTYRIVKGYTKNMKSPGQLAREAEECKNKRKQDDASGIDESFVGSTKKTQ